MASDRNNKGNDELEILEIKKRNPEEDGLEILGITEHRHEEDLEIGEPIKVNSTGPEEGLEIGEPIKVNKEEELDIQEIVPKKVMKITGYEDDMDSLIDEVNEVLEELSRTVPRDQIDATYLKGKKPFLGLGRREVYAIINY